MKLTQEQSEKLQNIEDNLRETFVPVVNGLANFAANFTIALGEAYLTIIKQMLSDSQQKSEEGDMNG